jgi:hypothetical protein
MPKINNKVEILRSLELTKEQFEVQYQQNCDGGENGQYSEFTSADKDFMESFLKIYQLGITQLQDFVNRLDQDSDTIDEYSILYYITQLSNGPFSNHFKQFTATNVAQRGGRSIYAPSNDYQGSMINAARSNSTLPVFNSTGLNAGLGIFNKSTPFIQDVLKDANTQTARIFDRNFQSSIFDDNTLPMIDKAPVARANAEGSLSFGAAGLGFRELGLIGPRFINAATSVAESIVQQYIGQIAIAGNNIIRDAIGQFAGLSPRAATQGVVQNITSSVLQNANIGSVGIIQQAQGQMQISGNNLAQNTINSLNTAVTQPLTNILQIPGNIIGSGAVTAVDNVFAGGTGFGTTIIGGMTQNAASTIGNLVPNLFNTSRSIIQNAGGQLLGSGTNIIQNGVGLLQGNIQNSLQGAMSLFSAQGISLNVGSFDNILQGALGNFQNIGQGIVQNAAGNIGSAIGKGLGGKGTLLGSFAIGFVGNLFGGKSPVKPSQSPVNALGPGGSNWTPGTANGNYMIRDVKMWHTIAESTENIITDLESSIGPAFRLLLYKKTLNYFNAEENESMSTGNPVLRLLTFLKRVRGESGNEEIKQQCVEIETSLLGNGAVGDSQNLKAYYNTGAMDLYTNTGRFGNRPIKLDEEDDDIKDDEKDDIFTNVPAATARAIKIGCSGYHTHTEDGSTYYMPCSSMEEYCARTGNCPEPVDPNNPLIGDVDCEELLMAEATTTTIGPETATTTTTTTTINPYDRPSPFVDIISALSQEDDDLPGF